MGHIVTTVLTFNSLSKICCYHVVWGEYLAISPGTDASEVVVLLRDLPGDLVELHLVVSLPHDDPGSDDTEDDEDEEEMTLLTTLSHCSAAAAHTALAQPHY